MLLLNSPHNPTGSRCSRRPELEAVGEGPLGATISSSSPTRCTSISTFDGEHIPIATLPGMADRTVTISSVGKTFWFTGWKIGWVSGPAELVDAVRAVKQFLTYVSGAPLQPAVAVALDLETTDDAEAGYVRELAASLAHRRDLLVGRAGDRLVCGRCDPRARTS